jgi:3-(3-hydroxy-phenyl)propionate hydroxylase/6-hydroxy-3-succinoylpyridine 3-monooxygenase
MRADGHASNIGAMERCEVVVVGAGPTGALTALGLAQRGRDVVLLEAESEVPDSPRALAYFWHLLEGLDRLGILDDMEARGFRNSKFLNRVLETGVEAEVSLAPVAAISPYTYNVHLGQHEVVKIALEHLARQGSAKVLFGARAAKLEEHGDRVRVLAETDDGPLELEAQWVLGADGARSTVRHSVGTGFDGMTWRDRFVATDIRYPFDERGGLGNANMLLDPANGCVIARIDETGLYRWTWSEDATLPEDTVLERLPGRLAALGFGADDYEVVRFTPYRMHQRSVDQMRAGHVILLGDAAHATNPTGGLGLTCGIYDALALVEPLTAVLAGEESDAALDVWAEARLKVFNELASPMAAGMKRMVYDEPDLAKREAMVRGAPGDSGPDEALEKFRKAMSLGTGLPRHHRDL